MEDRGEEIDEVDRDRWYLLRLDGGLYTLNSIDYILGWICMEDDGVSAFHRLVFNALNKNVDDPCFTRSAHMSSKCYAGKMPQLKTLLHA